ncbi:expressed unknown protein [Seminavis robusta]|uniref:Uncharacterized protein n=1 Tax=Seminavis robusta TaxID=568900 RepID=A0A9N8H2M6_9STRA|nr:expressed unknown protein [Seminavis robusta]|eukprot:Sro11_g008900.1 n/a (799) ;mRNA; f:193482-195878
MADPNRNSTTENGAERPALGYNRTRSADVDNRAYRNHSSQAATSQRALLARDWSTAHIIQGDGQISRDSQTNLEANLGNSWGSSGGGFGGDPVAGWAQGSWSNVAADPAHRSKSITTSHIPPMARQSRRAATEGASPRKSAILHPSAMHDAARLMDWDKVLQICQQNPASAGFVGHQGFTALHHLCSRRCPRADVAEAVIKGCPEALLMVETNKGWTPLHFACRFKCNKDVVHKLLNLVPQFGSKAVSKLDKQRRTPLWHAVRYDAPTGVVPQLLEVDPSVILKEGSESPLQLFWDAYAEKMEGRRALLPFIGEQEGERASPAVLRERLAKSKDLFNNWERANIFLKAAFRYHLDEKNALAHVGDRKWRILHVTAAAKCHASLFQMACVLHPEQARELDDRDLYAATDDSTETKNQTALHLAASSNASGPHGRGIIAELMRMYPEAVNMADQIDGGYPLHRIVENKHKQHWTLDGACAIFEANRQAVDARDSNGKVPLHRAATAIAAHHQRPNNNNDDDGDGDDDDQQDAPPVEVGNSSIIHNLLLLSPAAANVRDNDGCTPFHMVAMNCGDWTDEVQAVYAANTRAITMRAGRAVHNSLPIHLAAANPKATRSAIKKMVELNPRGVSQADGQGKLPLHMACELGKDWEDAGLDLIHNAFERAVTMPEENARHWTALHMAAASATPCGGLIKRLVELHPEACRIPDTEGRLPFHLACEAGKTWEKGLRHLFVGYPPAIATVDNEGRLPLYIVADQYAHASIARAMGEEDANHDAKESVELDVMYNLVRSDPTTVPEAS